MEENEEIVFNVTSNFGHNTQKPFVMIVVGKHDFMVQISPAGARELAINLLQAAEAAEGDAFLISFLRRKVGANDEAVAGILEEFRNWRERTEHS